MKQLFIFLFTSVLVTSCNYYQNDSWQSHYQMMDMGATVSGGDGGGGGGGSAFGGAFGDDFEYTPLNQRETSTSSYYCGEGGSPKHYTPYEVRSTNNYYRGTDENGAYQRNSDIGSYYGH